MLMALGVSLPKKVYGHPWLLFQNDKMSKSKGNIMYPDELVELFGVDGVRYYCLHEVSFANDGNITYELLIDRYNTDLANILGNLVNRTISMANKYFVGNVTNKGVSGQEDDELISLVNDLDSEVTGLVDSLNISGAISKIFDVFKRCNKYIDETTPWVLAKDIENRDRLETVIYNLLESIRVGALVLNPFLPSTSDKILEEINSKDKSLKFGSHEYSGMNASPIFLRIDKEEMLKKINL